MKYKSRAEEESDMEGFLLIVVLVGSLLCLGVVVASFFVR
jgi:hypothetical protein